MVRLKASGRGVCRRGRTRFQFHMVRLKGVEGQLRLAHAQISIPHGTIKRRITAR